MSHCNQLLLECRVLSRTCSSLSGVLVAAICCHLMSQNNVIPSQAHLHQREPFQGCADPEGEVTRICHAMANQFRIRTDHDLVLRPEGIAPATPKHTYKQ